MDFCLTKEVKEKLASLLHEKGENEAAGIILEEIDTCKATQKGKKRAPSRYNLFIKECMLEAKTQGKPKSLPECATEWTAQKK